MITGQLLDAETQLPIPSAFISGEKLFKGSHSNQDGYFSFYWTDHEVNEITISHLGYQDEILQIGPHIRDKSLTVLLRPGIIHLNPVLVKDVKERKSILTNDSIGHPLIQGLPGTNYLGSWVERDVLRSLKLFPGICSTDESATRLNIRGGTPDQNLILWDNIPIYHAGHFFGFFSPFNTALIETAEVQKGYYSSRYGGRSGSLINLTTKGARIKEKKASLNLTPLVIGGTMELPLLKNKGSIAIAGKKSLTKWLKGPLFSALYDNVFQIGKIAEAWVYNQNEEGDLQSTIEFQNYQLKLYWAPDSRNILKISTYLGGDTFTASSDSKMIKSEDYRSENNFGWSIIYERGITKNWQNQLELTGSQYTNRDENKLVETVNRLTYFSNRINDLNLRWEQQFTLGEKHRLLTGLQVSNRQLHNKVLLSLNQSTIDATEETSDLITNSTYVEYKGKISSNLTLEGGLRGNSYGSDIEMKNKWLLEPRMSLIWAPQNKNYQWAFSLSTFNQEIYRVPVLYDELDINASRWALANEAIYPIVQSEEVGINFEKNIGTWEGHFGLYHKRNRNVSAWKLDLELDGIDLINSLGILQSNGLEVFLLKTWKGGHRTHLSYTYANIWQKYPNINQGQKFYAAHQQANNLGIQHTFNWAKWQMVVDFNLIEGRPYSQPSSIQFFREEDGTQVYFPYYQSINSAKLPVYHRLDVHLNYLFNIAGKSNNIQLTLFNVYNRQNIQNIQYLVYPPLIDAGIYRPMLERLERKMLPLTLFLGVEINL